MPDSGGDYYDNLPVGADADVDRRRAEEAAQVAAENARAPQDLSAPSTGIRGRATVADLIANSPFADQPNQPTNLNDFYARAGQMNEFARTDPYSNAINQITRGSMAAQKGMTPNTIDWRRGMAAAKAQRWLSANPGTGSMRPDWAARAEHFQKNVPLEVLQKMGHEIAKARNLRKNIYLAQLAIAAATAGAGAYFQPATMAGGAALGAGGAAASAGTTAALTGNWDPKAIGIQVGTGAVTGGLSAGSGMNPMLAGGLSGATHGIARGFQTGKWDPGDLAWGVGTGIAGGALSGKGGAGVPSWVTSSAMPWANAAYNYTRGRPVNPITTGIQSGQGAITSAINTNRNKPGIPPWVDPSQAPPINPTNFQTPTPRG